MTARTLMVSLLLLAGCLEPPATPDPGGPPGPPFPPDSSPLPPVCHDGYCSLGEQLRCPEDCYAPSVCGDDVCSWDETCGSCAADCGACPVPVHCPSMPESDTLPLDVTGTTTGAASTIDGGSCGDGETSPAQSYAWSAPAAGAYAITVTAAFPIVLEVKHGTCVGGEAGCDAADPATTASVTVGLGKYQELDISLHGEGGASGTYELRIDRLPDACGDAACELGEACDVCVADCGTCPLPSYCGDGTCDGGESSASCSNDCGSPPSSCDPSDPFCF